MKRMKQKRGAFTLIELLVVITIIGILAGIALPVYGSIQERGSQTKALAQAKQVGLALKLFAGDNDGNFPQGGTLSGTDFTPDFGTAPTASQGSNYALKQLIPDYVNGEKIFYVAKSKWTPNPPDEVTTTFADRLKAGENHWAYVPLLNDTSNPNFPLLADGFSSTVGVYSPDQNVKGGVWKGKKAIVIRVDQSGTLENCQSTSYKVFGKTGSGTASVDIFLPTSWTPTNLPTALNPL